MMKNLFILLSLFTFVLIPHQSIAGRIDIPTFNTIVEELRIQFMAQAMERAELVKRVTGFNPQMAGERRIHLRTVPRDSLQNMKKKDGSPIIIPASDQKQEILNNISFLGNSGSVDGFSLGVDLPQMQHGEWLLKETGNFQNIYPLVLGSRGLSDLKYFILGTKRFDMPWSGVIGMCSRFNEQNCKKDWDFIKSMYKGFLKEFPRTRANIYLSTVSKSPFTQDTFSPALVAAKTNQLFDLGFEKVIFSDTAADLVEPEQTYEFLSALKTEGEKSVPGFFKKTGFHGHGPMAPVNAAIAACLGIPHIEIAMIDIPESGGCPTVAESRGHLNNARGVETIALLQNLGFGVPTVSETIKMVIQSPIFNYYNNYHPQR